MPYPIERVVNTFLQKDFMDGEAGISPLKMQKLVYFLHGWHLAITDEPVIEEKFRAWQYGPVEENLYHLLKSYRGREIDSYLQENIDGTERTLVVSQHQDMFYRILDMVWRKYAHFSAYQLSALTHEIDTPWYETYYYSNSPIIPNESIKAYFKGLMNGRE